LVRFLLVTTFGWRKSQGLDGRAYDKVSTREAVRGLFTIGEKRQRMANTGEKEKIRKGKRKRQ